MNLVSDTHDTLGSTSSTEYGNPNTYHEHNNVRQSLLNKDFVIGMNKYKEENDHILYDNLIRFINPFDSCSCPTNQKILWNKIYHLMLILLISLGLSFFVVYLVLKFFLQVNI